MKPPRLIGFAAFVLAGVFLLPGRAAGQFLSPRSLLSEERFPTFAATLAASGTNPLRLQSALRPVTKDNGLLLLGNGQSETVRTVRDGRHIGDVWGGSRFLFLRVPVAGTQWEFYRETGQQNGLFHSDSDQNYVANLKNENYSIRATFNPSRSASAASRPRQEWFLGYDDARADATGDSDALRKALPLFPGTPQATANARTRSVDLGGRFAIGPVSKPTWMEASLSSVRLTGAYALTESGVSVNLPLESQGTAWSLAARHPLRSSEMLLWAQNSRGAGSGPARVITHGESVTLGDSDVSTTENWFGAAWTRFYANGSRLTFLTEERRAETRLEGLGLLALPLGFDPDSVNRVSYRLRTNWRRRSAGVAYERPYRNGSRLTLDYRYLETPFTANYGYSGRLFLISTGAAAQWSLPGAQGHSLHLQYRFPLHFSGTKNPLLTVDATQFIPAAIFRHAASASSGGSPSPTSPKQTRGGWSAGISVQYPF